MPYVPRDHVAEEYTARVGPTRSLDNSSGPLEFNIEASPVHVTDLSQCYLKVRLKAVRRNTTTGAVEAVKHMHGLTADHLSDPGSIPTTWATTDADTAAGKPADDAKLSCLNNLFHTLYSDAELYVNETLVERVQEYPFVALFNTTLGFDRATKDSVLPALLGYYEDTPGKFSAAEGNEAHVARVHHLLLNGRETELKARLCFGALDASRVLPNHASIKILLTRKPSAFPLYWVDEANATGPAPNIAYELELVSAELEVRRLALVPSVARQEESRLAKKMGRFDFVKTQCKTFTFGAQRSDIVIENLFAGPVPFAVLVAMMPNAAYHGSLQSNSFEFKDYGLQQASLVVDGQIFPSPDGYQRVNADASKFTDAFLELYRAFPTAHGVTREQFKGGLFVLPFSLEDKRGQNGQVSLNFRFADALPETVTLLAVAYYRVHFVMDQMRNVSFTYVP